MPTIEADVTINHKREITLKLPPEVSPGDYHITLVIKDKVRPRSTFDFSSYPVGIIDSHVNFSRQELYNDRW